MRRLFTEKVRDRNLTNDLKSLRQHDLDNEWMGRGGGSGAASTDSIVRIDILGRAWVRLQPELWYCFTHTVIADEQPIFE
jgi:hypothetical protein